MISKESKKGERGNKEYMEKQNKYQHGRPQT